MVGWVEMMVGIGIGCVPPGQTQPKQVAQGYMDPLEVSSPLALNPQDVARFSVCHAQFVPVPVESPVAAYFVA